MTSRINNAVDSMHETILKCLELPDSKFPSMPGFSMSPLGSQLYSRLKVLRACILAENENGDVDAREAEAVKDGATWVKTLSKSVKSSIEAQMLGKIQ